MDEHGSRFQESSLRQRQVPDTAITGRSTPFLDLFRRTWLQIPGVKSEAASSPRHCNNRKGNWNFHTHQHHRSSLSSVTDAQKNWTSI
ncbi:hypothetical protein J6590_051457 [Homalodisca vitripennis]|nr:hypothetical protein J6590_051457 [Homalodisca vitripennis]